MRVLLNKWTNAKNKAIAIICKSLDLSNVLGIFAPDCEGTGLLQVGYSYNTHGNGVCVSSHKTGEVIDFDFGTFGSEAYKVWDFLKNQCQLGILCSFLFKPFLSDQTRFMATFEQLDPAHKRTKEETEALIELEIPQIFHGRPFIEFTTGFASA